MFTRNLPANNILLFLIAIVIWLPKFLIVPEYLCEGHSEAFLIDDFLQSDLGYLLHSLISFFVFFFTAILINSINIKQQIVDNVYQLPGFLFLVFSGLLINLQQITPELIANIFLLLAALRIFTVYKKKRVYSNLYDAGFFYALICFLQINLIFALPVILMSIFILRVFSIRELLSFLLGVITPVFIIFTVLYLLNDAELLIRFFESNYLNENYFKYSSINTMISIPLVLMFVFAIFNGIGSKSYKKVVTRKYVNITILFSVFFMGYFLSPYSGIESMIFLFAPLSVLLSNLYRTSSRVISFVLVFSLIISVIIAQIVQIMYIKSIV